jgi:hypothetical protein
VFLDRACSGQPALRKLVEALLEENDREASTRALGEAPRARTCGTCLWSADGFDALRTVSKVAVS